MRAERRLAKEEGISVGFSSGTNLAAALQLLAGPHRGQTIVIIVCDSGPKHLTIDLWTRAFVCDLFWRCTGPRALARCVHSMPRSFTATRTMSCGSCLRSTSRRPYRTPRRPHSRPAAVTTRRRRGDRLLRCPPMRSRGSSRPAGEPPQPGAQ